MIEKSRPKQHSGRQTPEASQVIRRVLIFDDDLVTALAGVSFAGIDVHLERSADDAENVVARLRPDIVLMDHHLMGSARTGDQAVTALRGLRSKDTLPIIGISSSTAGNAALIRAGANSSMPKSSVRQWLESGAPAGNLHI